MLEIEGLTKLWPRFSLALNLKLGDGEIVAVLGPSGCGKSTLLRLISGLERPDEGRILIDGHDVAGLPPDRRGIGMVFQDFALFPHLSVRGNIEYGPRMKGVSRRLRRKMAEAIAAEFEISPLLERSPYSLSGGEQQRVALARTLASNPAIVLLDEPLSSLDASLRHRLRTEIAKRLRELGKAAILVTHDAAEALAVADRIYLMRSGRVEAEGRSEELYAAPPTAWSATFLGRGPVLDILSLESDGSVFIAHTALGIFRGEHCPRGVGEKPASLFFPSEAPVSRSEGKSVVDGTSNRIVGRVVSTSFMGRSRKVSLDCSVVLGQAQGGKIVLDLELPSSMRPGVGETIALDVPSDRCFILP